ncbi:hypothetical protein ABZV14_41655 [Streptosporangium canum]|uniref:hypothetical protein n=1 Tax=Streptosporangium canum TaxID=324952 RepID=UPI0033A5CAC1
MSVIVLAGFVWYQRHLSDRGKSPSSRSGSFGVGGLGMGLTVAPLAQLTLEKVPARHAAAGSGLFNTIAQLAAS